MIDAIEHQLEDNMFEKTMFFNMPIIITNAELHIINEKLTTKDIEAAKTIEEVSTRQDFLFYPVKMNKSLWRYNEDKLRSYFSEKPDNLFLYKNKSFAKEFDHFIEVMSCNYCPETILIMHHDHTHKNIEHLFEYIETIISPSPEFIDKGRNLYTEWQNKINMIGNFKKRGLE